jgi:hypothetical protein
VIDRRSEAVQKGDGAESRVSRARPVTVTGQARRSTEQPLDLMGTWMERAASPSGPSFSLVVEGVGFAQLEPDTHHRVLL